MTELEFQWIPMEKGRTTLGRQSQIYKVLSIGKSTYDARLKYLKSDPTKDAERTCLNAQQMKLMEDLNEHIQELTGAVQCRSCGLC